MLLDNDGVSVGVAVAGGHCEVGDGSESRDEGCQDVEQTFFLDGISYVQCCTWSAVLTTGTRKAIAAKAIVEISMITKTTLQFEY